MNSNCELCGFKSYAAEKLTQKELEELSKNCAEVLLKNGDILIQQGVLSSNIAYLKKGLVKVHIAGPKYEQITRITKAPSYLGLPTTFGDKVNHYSVTVIEDSVVCFIDVNTFRNLLASNDKFAYEIIIALCNNELNSFKKCVNRTQKQNRGNIADVLLDFSDRIYSSDVFTLPITRSEMGNLVDTSRESVSRILHEFEQDGIIRLTGKQVEILNKDMLKLIGEKG
jgi:CRP/FNR family transcriptional regulator